MKTDKLFLSIAAVSFTGFHAYGAQDVQRPNIIIIMADQLRADLVKREGYPLNTMPFADSLARTGTWFNRAYTAAPASGPARVSLLTGRYPSATRVRSNHNIRDAFFEKDLFDVAREQGYKTALVGKNHSHLSDKKADHWSIFDHLGQQSKNKSSKAAEFDRFLASTDFYASLEPAPFGTETQLPYRMVDDASGWVGSLSGTPFLIWFSIPEPHNPYQTCEPYYSMFPPESLPKMRSSMSDLTIKGSKYEILSEMMEQGHEGYIENLQRLRSIYHGMLRMIDDQLARLTVELKKLGVYDNTIIVFIADHGDYVGEYGLMKKGAGLDEVLTRIPMQWSGPGIKASELPHKAHVNIVDIFPTVCEIIGAPVPVGVQGRSLWPMLQGYPYPEEEFESMMVEDGYGGMYYTKADGTDYAVEGAVGKKPGLFFDELNTWSQSGTMHMLRSNEWKLVYDMDGNGQLYNLLKDPAELNNLYHDKKHTKTKDKMLEMLLRWELSTRDHLPIPGKRYRFKRNEHNYLFKVNES
ncbi:MAG: sulfatase-like hydrolase/transferase [Bacteroidales bacterium]|jgi:arylsulfatase A-like enzyme|nr:sulfatase-like hydrolase/transferase [Bacteroidales bacterium]